RCWVGVWAWAGGLYNPPEDPMDTSMAFQTLIQKMTQAAVRGDGPGVAACFCENGIYHDVFYGEFRGNAIINLIE
ncbi:MAG TPA: hypothetical protein DCS41_09185, partial [Gammaproteobacteria bacterium]|nr:hypothetical protein [Gammaproteobacteria bacterium]